MKSLDKVKVGVKGKIIKIDAGKGLLGQLKHMGLQEGETIKVVQNIRGPIIVAKGNLRFALGRGMSHKIIIEEIDK